VSEQSAYAMCERVVEARKKKKSACGLLGYLGRYPGMLECKVRVI
jgi:hypothetical protein